MTSRIVISAATAAVTNMTGLRTNSRGLSFRNDALIAGTTRSAVNRLLDWAFAMMAPDQNSWPRIIAR